MNDLIEFLNAQVDGDDRAACEASSAPWSTPITGCVHVDPRAQADNTLAWGRLGYVATVEHEGDRQHIARHHPARVLREVAAKRALLADLLAEPHFLNDREWYGCRAMAEGEGDGPDVPTGQECTCGRDARVEHRIRILAQPYADRPGWKEEWRV